MGRVLWYRTTGRIDHHDRSQSRFAELWHIGLRTGGGENLKMVISNFIKAPRVRISNPMSHFLSPCKVKPPREVVSLDSGGLPLEHIQISTRAGGPVAQGQRLSSSTVHSGDVTVKSYTKLTSRISTATLQNPPSRFPDFWRAGDVKTFS